MNDLSTFQALRCALSSMLESLLYAETDISANTCADYASELRRAIAAVCAATTFEDLAAVSYIQGQAALGAENISEAIERGEVAL